ncbi:MAG: VOC family protein, partial [Armatimonadota bacterium]|nr:VOC family protein [Armatimonadota bacterium]
MDIRSLQHCSLVVRDLERSRWFYGKVLGLEEVPRPSTFTFRGAWFRRQNAEVHLILAEDTTAPPGFPEAGSAKRTGLATHFAFEVADLEAAREELLRAGIPILG